MYRVKCTPNYYASTINAPQAHYVTIDEVIGQPNVINYIYEWDTAEEAQEWIDEQQRRTYYLSHGEAGRPAYEVINTDEDADNDCITHDASDGSWEMIDKDELPDGVKDELDSKNVDYDSRYDDEYDLYTAEITDDETGYRISFAVSTCAIQDNIDDLGGIDWTNPTYYVEK